MSIFKRASCAYREGDMNGPTYDGKGQLCGGLSKEDKMYIAIAGAFCGAVILGLGITYLVRRRRQRRSHASDAQSMSEAHHTPLLGGWGSQHLRRNNGPSHLDMSPINSPTVPSPPSPGLSFSSTSSETFHFPILSADGHLLPPAPASAARSPHLVSPVLSERPLPSPPMESSAFISRPKSVGYTPVVGLWPGQRFDDAELDIGQANMLNIRQPGGRLSPIIGSPASMATTHFSGLGYAQAQTATIHHAHSYSYDERGHLVRDYQ